MPICPGMKEKTMLARSLKIMCALLFAGVMLAQTGCACGTAKGCVTAKAPCGTTKVAYATPAKVSYVTPSDPCHKNAGEVTAALPPNARSGECYAKVFIPAQFKNVTERVLVRDASETIEIIPARYEWVEERILVKDASTQLEAVPAEFASRERTFEVSSGHTDWEVNKNPLCVSPKDQPARDVFCLVTHPSAQKTIQTQHQVKPARVQEVCIPAQYETVRRQKLASAATTRKVCNPAEYENIEKSVKVCDGRMAWERVVCDPSNPETVAINANRTSTVTTVTMKSTPQP